MKPGQGESKQGGDAGKEISKFGIFGKRPRGGGGSGGGGEQQGGSGGKGKRAGPEAKVTAWRGVAPTTGQVIMVGPDAFYYKLVANPITT
jgi:hypothetical protein